MKTIHYADNYQQDYTYRLSAPMGGDFHPEFAPELSPPQMLKIGVFGGLYFADQPHDLPKQWFVEAKLSADGRRHKELNFFGVNASQPLWKWRQNGWIHPQDPRGWFQWYCRYYLGRRSDDDLRQIKRWKAYRRHLIPVLRNCDAGDWTCRTKQRQSLLHWAYDSREI